MGNLPGVFMRLPPTNLRLPPAFEAKLEIYGRAACVMLRDHDQMFQVVCLELVDMKYTANSWLSTIEHVHDRAHPLLRQFVDVQVELMFRGKPQDPAQLVGDLWLAHRRMASDWIPFERYLDHRRPLPDVLAVGFGSLGEGPRFLLEAYAEVLTKHGVTADLSEARQDGRQRPVPEHALVFDHGHIVALEYDAT